MLPSLLALLLAQAPPPAATEPPDRWGRSVRASSRVLGESLNLYFSVDDYPAAAERAEEQGAVRFRLAIAPDGRVDCVVTRSSGSAVLDRNTCGILGRRLRYDRLRHLRGRRLPASDSGIVRWNLAPDRQRRSYPALVPPPHGWNIEVPPANEAAPAEPPIQVSSRLRGAELNRFFSRDDYPAAALRSEEEGNVGFRLSIGPNGRVAQCTITSSSGSRALDSATCRILKARVPYAPADAPRSGRSATSDEGTARWRLPADRPRPPAVETYTD